MTTRGQNLRSSTPGQSPPAGTRLPGELWINFADLQMGYIDAGKNAQRVVAVRYFSTAANYAAGDFVVQAGGIWVAKSAVTAGAFNSTQWSELAYLTDIPAPYVLPTASPSVLGGVKIDNSSITIASGVISAVGSAPSGATPVMDGAATAGVATAYSRGDHVHPTDTTRAAVSALPVVATTVPLIDGTATIGASGKWADGAHVHPTDTSRAPVVGVTNASSAAAGQIGEWLVAQQLTNVPLTTAVVQNLVILSLTAGDWDVDANVYFVFSAANGSSTVASVSIVSGTHPAVGNAGTGRNLMGGTGTQSGMSVPTGRVRVNVSATTNVYIVVTAIFASGTCNCQGTIQARRMR